MFLSFELKQQRGESPKCEARPALVPLQEFLWLTFESVVSFPLLPVPSLFFFFFFVVSLFCFVLFALSVTALRCTTEMY